MQKEPGDPQPFSTIEVTQVRCGQERKPDAGVVV
jgi:hypothetical protein